MKCPVAFSSRKPLFHPLFRKYSTRYPIKNRKVFLTAFSNTGKDVIKVFEVHKCLAEDHNPSCPDRGAKLLRHLRVGILCTVHDGEIRKERLKSKSRCIFAAAFCFVCFARSIHPAIRRIVVESAMHPLEPPWKPGIIPA